MTPQERWLAGGDVLVVRPTWARTVEAWIAWRANEGVSGSRATDMLRSAAGGTALFMVVNDELRNRVLGLRLDAVDGKEYLSAGARMAVMQRVRPRG